MRLSIPRILSLAVLSVPGLLVAQEPLFVQEVGAGQPPAFSSTWANRRSGVADQFKLNRQAVINGVTWHGVVQDRQFDPTTTPMTFLIEFFDERRGRPSGPPVHSALVAPVVRETGLTLTRDSFFEGFAIYEFATQLMPPLGVRKRHRLWVSIARWEPEPGNQFLWCRSPGPGATYATISNGVFTLRHARPQSRGGPVSANFAFQLFGNE